MYVITIRPWFAKMTFHDKKKTTHVAVNSIFADRLGECMVVKVSGNENQIGWKECGEQEAGGEDAVCDPACGCCVPGHIVGIVQIGETYKVSKKDANGAEWRSKTYCTVNKKHVFLSELTTIRKLSKSYKFPNGNVFPVVGMIPTSIIPEDILQECVNSSAILQKRVADKKKTP